MSYYSQRLAKSYRDPHCTWYMLTEFVEANLVHIKLLSYIDASTITLHRLDNAWTIVRAKHIH